MSSSEREGARSRRRNSSSARSAEGSRYRTRKPQPSPRAKPASSDAGESTAEDRIAATLRGSLENTQQGLAALHAALQRGRWEESLRGWTQVATLLPEQAAWARRQGRTELDDELAVIAARAQQMVATFEGYAEMLRVLSSIADRRA